MKDILASEKCEAALQRKVVLGWFEIFYIVQRYRSAINSRVKGFLLDILLLLKMELSGSTDNNNICVKSYN